MEQMIQDATKSKKSLACWIVVRDDSYYIDMAIKSVLPYVEGIYILDTGSTDNTIEVIESFKSPKIHLDKERHNFDRPNFDKGDHTWTHPYWQWNEKYDGNSLEAETRNKCVFRCIKRFNPDWLLQLDADEVFTPLFFKQLSNYNLKKTVAISHSTEWFVTNKLFRRDMNKHIFNPHVRSWNAHLPIKWAKPDKKSGHVSPRFNAFGAPSWMDGIVHIHLHNTFGPKADSWKNTQKKEVLDIINKEACFTSYNWDGLDFVVEKWKKWGGWVD